MASKKAKEKADVVKAKLSVDFLQEKVNEIDRFRAHKISDLYVELLANCEEVVEVFEHYLQHAVHHFLTIIFELKILSNGRLHNKQEELRYADYLVPNQIGSFDGQSFTGNESERNCKLTSLSCDGIQFGILRKVSIVSLVNYGLNCDLSSLMTGTQ